VKWLAFASPDLSNEQDAMLTISILYVNTLFFFATKNALEQAFPADQQV